jgi:hypothetical protein
MRNEYRSLANTPVNTVVAVILIGLGLVWVLKPSIYVDLGLLTGPGFMTVLGILLFVMALNVDPPGGELLAIAGTVVAMVGMILAYQDATHQWTVWTYAWALVLPTSIGLGQILYGSITGRSSLVTIGKLAMFLAGVIFFELIIGVSGFDLGHWGLPILFIGGGALLFVRSFRPTRKAGAN